MGRWPIALASAADRVRGGTTLDDPRKKARDLRTSQTDAERALWAKLRNRRFASFKFRRQVPLGTYIVDFVCFAEKLIIELDGGQHTTQVEYDKRRTDWLMSEGFRVIRIWNHQVWEEADAVEELIWQKLHEPRGRP